MGKEIGVKIKIDSQEVVSGSKQVDELTQSIDALQSELTSLGKRTEENADLFDELTGDLEQLQKAFNDTTKDVDKTTTALDKNNKELEDVSKSAAGTKKGFSSMAGGLKGIGTAIKASGIGLLLGLLASLFEALKKNQKVMDFLQKATMTLSIVFNKLFKAIEPVGDMLVKAFENPQQAIKDLWALIKENLINRFNGMIDFWKQSFDGILNTIKGVSYAVKGIFSDEAKKKSKEFFEAAEEDAKKAGESFLQMTTGIDDLPNKAKKAFGDLKSELNGATEAADEYVKKQNELILAEGELNKFIAKNKATIESLILVRDDETKSAKERIEAAKQVNALIDEEQQKAISLQEQKIEQLKTEQELNGVTIEGTKAIMDAEAELDNMRADAFSRHRENLMAINTIEKQQADEKKAREEKEAAEQKAKDDAELERLKSFRAEKQDLENQWALEDAETADEYYNALIEQENQRYQDKIDNVNLTNEELEFYEQEHQRNMAKIAADGAATQIKIQNELTKQRMAAAQITADILGQTADMFEESTVAHKALASASALINTYLSATQVYAAVSTLTIPAAPILAALAAASAVASGLMTVAKINNVQIGGSSSKGQSNVNAQPPKQGNDVSNLGRNYGDGGFIDGPSHAAGGQLVNAEGGETILNKNTSAMFLPLLSAMNVAGGGVPLSGNVASMVNSDNPITTEPQLDNQIITKTYVVASEMTDQQEANERLKDLSTI